MTRMPPIRPWHSYNIHGLVTVKCNRNDYFPEYFLANDTTNPDLILNVSNRNPSILKDFCQIGTDIFCSTANRQVFSKINILGLKGMLTIKNLIGTLTEATINGRYPFLGKTLLKVPVSTAFPDKAFAQMLLHVKLLLKNRTFMVASGFKPANQNSATLVSSMGGMGKTSAIFNALETIGGKYLGDDMVIVDAKGTVYAYPKPVRIRRFSSIFSLESYKHPEQILRSKDAIAESCPIGNVLLLERGATDKITSIGSTDASRKLLVITRKLLPYYMERTILAYSYMDTSFDLSKLLIDESVLQSKFLEHAECYVLTSKIGNPKSVIKLMKEIL